MLTVKLYAFESSMITDSFPQLKVITPPAASALANAASVQLAEVPVPTYALLTPHSLMFIFLHTAVVGLETSAGLTVGVQMVGGALWKLTESWSFI